MKILSSKHAVSTRSGAHLTSDDVIRALKKREERRNLKRGQGAAANGKEMKYESAAELRLLASLAPGRANCRRKLALTRRFRRTKARNNAILKVL